MTLSGDRPDAQPEAEPADVAAADAGMQASSAGAGWVGNDDPAAPPGAAAADAPGPPSSSASDVAMTAGRDVDKVAPRRLSSDEQDRAILGSPEGLRAVLEAVLLVVDTPTSAVLLAQVLGRPVAQVEDALRALSAEYDSAGRGIDLREVAGGWRLYSRDEFALYVERFVLDGQQARLTQAALETLAVIAYRQPVTRSRVSAIRGVNVDSVVRTLLGRGLVEECGVDSETGGGLYRTTDLFLEKLGLGSLGDLPSLAPLLPDTSDLDDVGLST